MEDDKDDIVEAALNQLSDAFGDRLYIELHRHQERAEADTEGALVDLAYKLGLPLVAANDIRFEKRSDHGAHPSCSGTDSRADGPGPKGGYASNSGALQSRLFDRLQNGKLHPAGLRAL